MDTENLPPAQPDETDLQEQIRWLQKQIKVLLILAILISGTIGIYLLRQWNYARKDLARIEPVVTKYHAERAPAIDNFLQNLQDYGRTHPEIVPLLTKYGLGPTNVLTAPPAR
jgi:hypothetical protein